MESLGFEAADIDEMVRQGMQSPSQPRTGGESQPPASQPDSGLGPPQFSRPSPGGSGPCGSVQTSAPTFVFRRVTPAAAGNLGDRPPHQVVYTFVEPKGVNRSWVWDLMQCFEPPTREGKTVMCMCSVPATEGGQLHPLDNEEMAAGDKRYICGWLSTWKGSTYTPNLTKHVKTAHYADWDAGQKKSDRTQVSKQERMRGLQTVTGGMRPGAEFTSDMRTKFRKIQVLWCAWNLRPPNMLADEGFILVSSFLYAPSATTKVSHDHISRLLAALCFKEMSRLKDLIAGVFQTFPRAIGPVFSGQLDGWTAKDTTAYWAFSVSWMDEKFARQRVCIAFKQFPGRHTAERVAEWIQEVTKAFFGGKEPREVFVALTTDGGSNLTDLERRLGIFRHQCDAHLLNTVVSWSVGKAGTKDTENVYGPGGALVRAATVGTCQHKEILPFLKAVKTVVKHFQNSTSANEALQDIQRNFEVEDPDGFREAFKALKPVLANDTRWTPNYDMLVRMMRMKQPIGLYFQHNDSDKVLDPDQWKAISHLVGVLQNANELAVRLQGGEGSFISTAYKMKANFKKATAYNTFDVPIGLSSDNDAGETFDYMSVPVHDANDLFAETLHERAARCREILLDRMEIYNFCKVTHATPMMCIMLNPTTQRLHAQFAGEEEDGWVYDSDMDGELLLRKEYERVWKEQNPLFQHQSGFIWHGTRYWPLQSPATQLNPNGGMDPTKVTSDNLGLQPPGAGAAPVRPAAKRKTLDDWDAPMGPLRLRMKRPVVR